MPYAKQLVMVWWDFYSIIVKVHNGLIKLEPKQRNLQYQSNTKIQFFTDIYCSRLIVAHTQSYNILTWLKSPFLVTKQVRINHEVLHQPRFISVKLRSICCYHLPGEFNAVVWISQDKCIACTGRFQSPAPFSIYDLA